VNVRVYVPSTPHRLRDLVAAGAIRSVPVSAHAVTAAVRAGLPDGGEEDWEYAAASAAAQTSLGMLTDGEPPRRVVLALDVPAPREVGGDDDPTLVELGEQVPLRRLAAVLADSADAEADVAAARDALAARTAEADLLAERCLDHELGWWAVQEVEVLLVESGAG
jgi:hypothetical protein